MADGRLAPVWSVFKQDTVFIDQKVHCPAAAPITERFDRHQNLIMFPEGSSYTNPYFAVSIVFAVANIRWMGLITVQPVSVTFAQLDGLPIPDFGRILVIWQFPHCAPYHGAAGLGKLTMVVKASAQNPCRF